MAELKWWNKPLRMIQYNLQMKDTPLMDAEKIARETEEMGGNVVIINVSDSVVWYHTKIHCQKINPYLPKDRDWLKEMIDAFHKRNIKVIARGAFMGMEEETYYQRPDWVCRNPDGSPVMSGNERPGEWFRLYKPCPNSGFMNEGGGLDVGVEAFSEYDLDGAFWLGGSSWANNCWCDTCKKLYKEICGEEMPNDPAKIKPRWSEERNRKLAVHFKDEILKVKPDMPYMRYYWAFNFDIGLGGEHPLDDIEVMAKEGNLLCTEAQNTLSQGIKNLREWNLPATEIKMGRTVEGFPPPVGIIHACPGMDWRHTCLPEAEFMYWSAQVVANGGSMWSTFTGFPDTIPDKRMMKAVGKINEMIKKVEDVMEDAKSDCQVMLISDNTVSVHGWSEALMCAHIDFDMIGDYQLKFDRIKDYPVVIVTQNMKYTENAEEIFTKYVEAGGNLIVEGTSEMKLAPVKKLLGVKGNVVSSEELESTYIRLEKSESGLQEKIGECELVPLRGKVGFCQAEDGASVFTTWVPSFAPAKVSGFPPERASLPKSHTDVPMCIVSEHGNGKVMFLPYEPGRMVREYGMQDMFTMIQGYTEYMLGSSKKMMVKAPYRVMTTVFKKENLHMVHLVNGIGHRPLLETIPCYKLEISLKLDGKIVQSVRSQIAGCEVEYHVADDVLTVKLPKLEVWDMLLIQYA